MTDRIPQPTIRLSEVALALFDIPPKRRRRVAAALDRVADDYGWSEDIRGLCVVLLGALADFDAGVPLVDQLGALDRLDVTDGSLSWVVADAGKSS